jgi:hypothetical protein
VKFPRIIDPDWNWRSGDKVQHAAGGFALCLVFDAVLPIRQALMLTLWTAAVFEAGQTDVAISLHKLGAPGYGFGLADLLAGSVGACLYLLLSRAL